MRYYENRQCMNYLASRHSFQLPLGLFWNTFVKYDQQFVEKNNLYDVPVVFCFR